jgi:hypothetical protein
MEEEMQEIALDLLWLIWIGIPNKIINREEKHLNHSILLLMQRIPKYSESPSRTLFKGLIYMIVESTFKLSGGPCSITNQRDFVHLGLPISDKVFI